MSLKMSSFKGSQFSRWPQLGLLSGALAFSLSALPTLTSSAAGSVSLSSESKPCTLSSQLEHGDEAQCKATKTVDGLDVSGTLHVHVKTGKVRDMDHGGELVDGKVWVIDGQSEVECDEGCENGRRSLSFSKEVSFAQFHDITDLAISQFSDAAKEVAATEKKAREKAELQKELQAQIDACEVNENGKAFKDDDQQLNCRAKRLSQLSGKAADKYFEKYVRSDLENLLSSGRADDASRALQIMGAIAGHGSRSGHDITSVSQLADLLGRSGTLSGMRALKESLTDLMTFGVSEARASAVKDQLNTYGQQYSALAAQMNLLAPNDPRRATFQAALNQISQNANQLQLTGVQDGQAANTYFTNRGLSLPNETWVANAGLTTDFNLALQDYEARLNNAFSPIVAMHQNAIANVGTATTPFAGNPVVAGTTATPNWFQSTGIPVTAANTPATTQVSSTGIQPGWFSNSQVAAAATTAPTVAARAAAVPAARSGLH